jgi:CBS domain-containing protein
MLRGAGLGALILLVAIPVLAGAAETGRRDARISDQLDRQILAILQDSYKVYRNDPVKEKATNERIDEYFGRYLDVKKAKPAPKKMSTSLTYRLSSAETRPIRWEGKDVERDRSHPPGFVWYTKQPYKRSFLKEVSLPTKKTVGDGRAIAITQKFITDNRFTTVTTNDTLKPAGVLMRKKQEYRPDGKTGQAVILSQRVTFFRQIDGLPVLNAKQTVDLHGDSGEIVGYKKIRWAEIAEGESMPNRPKSEIVSEIQELLTKKGADYTIRKVVPALYQASDRIVPVLAVQTARNVENGRFEPIQETFLLSLVQGIDGGQSQPSSTRRLPTRAEKP